MKKVVLGVLVAAVVAVVGGAAQAASEKYWVHHKGDAICVDDDSISAHLGHGDHTDWIRCD